MERAVEKLRRVGLTEYEAKAYIALLSTHLATATQTSVKSGVPRTKIYAVLESLKQKGWVHIISGVPLLFKAVDPLAVFEQIKEDYANFLNATQATLTEKVNNVKEKFVIKRFDIGLEALKDEMRKAKTLEVNNATAGFIKKVSDAFKPGAKVRVLMFPGEAKPTGMPSVEFKQAEVEIVTIIRGKEMPSMSITLDEARTFTAFQDPVDHRYVVEEMLYDECQRCFSDWSGMSWSNAEELTR
ncbi:MAG: TrmB family transcriptional regulator [Candidatus Bathyarchaeia archaeon]